MKDKTTSVSGIQGLNKDQTFQTPNQVTFALNAIRDSHDGGKPEYQSEPGNELVQSLPSGYVLLGHAYGQNNTVYLFSTNSTLSEIGKFKEGRYTTLVNANLGFNRQYPITAEFRIKNGCDPVIYWFDHLNPDRFFNENRPEDFQTTGVFDPNKFRMVPTVLPPSIDLNQVNNSGGSLQLGSYYFQLEYLDNADNQVYVSDITPQVVIYDEALNSPYYNIDGGLNTPQYDPAIGGVPTTNKSITLRFSNLNTSFSNLRVNVFSALNGIGTFTGHSVGTLIPITDTLITWTYTGYNPSAGDFTIDVSEKIIDNITYESAYVGEQVQNHLVRANLKQSSRDYSQYQSYASQITARWVAKEVKMDDNTIVGNPKNPNTYWYGRGFMGDEVYLPGVRYLHTDGTWSPVFPLIGRIPTFDDLNLLTVVSNGAVLGSNDVWLSDVDHLDLSIGQTVPTWKVFNTATITTSNTTTHPYDYEGRFAYYELDTTYPNIRDCDDNLIWGEGITTDTKVRLFKFPDRRLISHIDQTGEYILPFGIKFNDITYPNADIIAHQFMFADRSNNLDKTVLDSGWLTKPDTTNAGTVDETVTLRGLLTHNATQAQNNARFNSTKTLFDSDLSNFNYYKVNRLYNFKSQIVPTPGDFTDLSLGGGDTLTSFIAYMDVNQHTVPLRTNYEELKSVRIDSGTILSGVTDMPSIESLDYYTGDTVSRLSFALEDTTGLLPTQFSDPHLQSTDIYVSVHNFYAYKKASIQPYSNFLFRQFKYINHNPSYSLVNNTFYGGDTLISETQDFRYELESDTGGTKFITSTLYKDHYEEHEINTALRHEGTEFKYFKIGKSDNYVLLKVSDGAEFYPEDNIIREYYAYNRDYNVRSLERSKLPLPSSFDYCSSCVGKYPHRIIFSPVSFDEENFDLYRVTYTNDYIDLPGHTGAITGLKFKDNKLIVHTEETTYILQPSPQQIQTDQNTAYLGTGDFLSVPPVDMFANDTGMGGCQSKQHQVDTPYGHCWLDQKRGMLLSFNTQVSILNVGLEQWLREYLPSEMQKTYYNINGIQYPILNTNHIDGVGCRLYYDPRFKRLLITKLDFKPKQLITNSTTATNSQQVKYNGRWISAQGEFPVNLDNVFFFANTSWTLSYGFEYQSFISWHSYRPYEAFNDNDNYYTLNRFTNNISRHKRLQSYQNYYGTKYNFIIEYQAFDLSTDRLSTVHYTGYTYQWDATNKQWLTIDNSTFSKIVCYNNDQTTGEQDLIMLSSPYQNVFLNGYEKYVIKTDQNYKIAGLMDVATGQPVMIADENIIGGSDYIDKTTNSSAVNVNKSIYTQGKLWDKFVNVRLFFNHTQDYKKIIILTNINEQQSIR